MPENLVGKSWRWYANSSGIFLIVLIVTYGIVAGLDERGQVMKVERVHLVTPTVPSLGTVQYRTSYERRKSCPGTRVISFNRESPRESIVLSAPATHLAIGPVTDSLVSIKLPASVYPGPWRVIVTLDSSCPSHKQRDLVADFKILVHSDVD